MLHEVVKAGMIGDRQRAVDADLRGISGLDRATGQQADAVGTDLRQVSPASRVSSPDRAGSCPTGAPSAAPLPATGTLRRIAAAPGAAAARARPGSGWLPALLRSLRPGPRESAARRAFPRRSATAPRGPRRGAETSSADGHRSRARAACRREPAPAPRRSPGPAAPNRPGPRHRRSIGRPARSGAARCPARVPPGTRSASRSRGRTACARRPAAAPPCAGRGVAPPPARRWSPRWPPFFRGASPARRGRAPEIPAAAARPDPGTTASRAAAVRARRAPPAGRARDPPARRPWAAGL